MNCTQKIIKCLSCSGGHRLVRGIFVYTQGKKLYIDYNALGCEMCMDVYAKGGEPDPICNGELERQGKIFICKNCGCSYSPNDVINQRKIDSIIEGFSGV